MGNPFLLSIRLITYRETYLLVDAKTSTQKTKQEVALVVAHELAHQWFGNLVVSCVSSICTIHWASLFRRWNGGMTSGWMKISVTCVLIRSPCFLFFCFPRFASWIEFLAVDHVYPEYDIWTQFVSDTLATSMIPDALQNSHPIEVPIEKPSDIDEIFDDITYEKGRAFAEKDGLDEWIF